MGGSRRGLPRARARHSGTFWVSYFLVVRVRHTSVCRHARVCVDIVCNIRIYTRVRRETDHYEWLYFFQEGDETEKLNRLWVEKNYTAQTRLPPVVPGRHRLFFQSNRTFRPQSQDGSCPGRFLCRRSVRRSTVCLSSSVWNYWVASTHRNDSNRRKTLKHTPCNPNSGAHEAQFKHTTISCQSQRNNGFLGKTYACKYRIVRATIGIRKKTTKSPKILCFQVLTWFIPGRVWCARRKTNKTGRYNPTHAFEYFGRNLTRRGVCPHRRKSYSPVGSSEREHTLTRNYRR